MSATNLLEMTPDEIVAFVEGLGEPAYRGRQLATWVYVKGVADVAGMTDLTRGLRERLAAVAVVSPPAVVARHVSRDGSVASLVTSSAPMARDPRTAPVIRTIRE